MVKAYPKYKYSGVPWFGDVPDHWQTPRLGAVLKERKEVNKSNEVTKILSVMRDIGVIPYEEKGNVGNKCSEDITRYKVVRPGDIVANCMNIIIGSVGISKYTGCLSPVYYVLTPRSDEDDSHYFDYVFKVKAFQRSLVRIGNGILAHRMRIPMELLKCEIVPKPPLAEQKAIAVYLDNINKMFRLYIRSKQQVIKLLNEQKQAIISKAVTRGINPNARLKPSGADWLGDVPEHWDVRKLKFEMRSSGGGTPSKAVESYWNGSIPWVSPKDMKSEIIYDTEDHITEQAVAESSTKIVPVGSILMVVRSGILQRTIPIASCSCPVALNQDIKALTSKGRINPEYFILLVRGCEKSLLLEWTKQGATVESIEHQFLANTFIPIPPKDEQSIIVQYVERETAHFDNNIDVIKKEITLLKEYKDRLIGDVTTGKIAVNDAKLLDVPDIDIQEVINEEEISEDAEDSEEVVNADE